MDEYTWMIDLNQPYVDIEYRKHVTYAEPTLDIRQTYEVIV